MREDFSVPTGDYIEQEKRRYPLEPFTPEYRTGFIQERKVTPEEIREDLQKKYTNLIDNLWKQVESLGSRLKELEEELQLGEEAMEIRDVPMERIKEEMLSLLSDGETRHAGDIAAKLRLDIKDVIEAFRQLQEEGKLFVDESKL